MCELCGCADGADHFHVGGHAVGNRAQALHIDVHQALLAGNDRLAAHNRAHFDAAGVLAVNLMSSPGSGKTSLLEATIGALRGILSIAVIEGDLQTENDARRIRAAGAPAVQITTGNACHLDANMVHAALHDLDLSAIDVLFIENVGNLVCPASFDLGQHRNVVLLSVAEGDDKPEKYPVMFRKADLVALTKLDLLEAVGDFDPARARRHIRNLASDAPVLEVSARTGQGMASWIEWLVLQRADRSHAPAQRHAPHV
jgi:hydrogenase nickel incorporation protein HypB